MDIETLKTREATYVYSVDWDEDDPELRLPDNERPALEEEARDNMMAILNLDAQDLPKAAEAAERALKYGASVRFISFQSRGGQR